LKWKERDGDSMRMETNLAEPQNDLRRKWTAPKYDYQWGGDKTPTMSGPVKRLFNFDTRTEILTTPHITRRFDWLHQGSCRCPSTIRAVNSSRIQSSPNIFYQTKHRINFISTLFFDRLTSGHGREQPLHDDSVRHSE